MLSHLLYNSTVTPTNPCIEPSDLQPLDLTSAYKQSYNLTYSPQSKYTVVYSKYTLHGCLPNLTKSSTHYALYSACGAYETVLQ